MQGENDRKDEDLRQISEQLQTLLRQNTQLIEANKSFDKRLSNIENNFDENGRPAEADEIDTIQDGGERADNIIADFGRFLPQMAQGATAISANSAALEITHEYENVRSSVQRIQLPADLKLLESQSGIKQDQKPALKIVTKCGRFAETGLKLLSQWVDRATRSGGEIRLHDAELQRMFHILFGQITFLRGEYAGLVVASSFDSETARIFRQFESNQASFDSRSLQNIRVAAELSSISARNTRGRGRFEPRGRGARRGSAGFAQHRNFGNGNDDIFSGFTARRNTFPARRGGGYQGGYQGQQEQ